MKNVLELLINNTKFVANKSKTILAILLITAFVVLLAFIEAYVLTTISDCLVWYWFYH